MIKLDPTVAGAKTRATDPGTGEPIGPSFFEASIKDVERAYCAAKDAEVQLASDACRRSELLDEIASQLERSKEELIECANRETALPEGRLAGELVRTRSQLKMFAEVLREGSWVDATIDQGDASRQPPKPDLRRMLVPLGPVAVFGASNFPLAFSVPGGDTASALAAGCPVVVKAHPAHPGTSELAADAIREAVKAVGLPSGVFSLLHGGIEVSRWLVMNEHAEAVAFTGSLAAGRSLYDLAASRARPIPVLAEMGSINPLLLMPKALEHRFDALVEGYVGSLTAGVGQFCTNPGLVLGAGSRFEMFIEAVGERLKSAQPGTMLTSRMRELYHEGCAERSSIQGLVTFGNGKHSRGQVMPAIFSVGLDKFMKHPLLLEELFGPAAVAVTCPSVEGMLEALSAVPGQLTATIHATDEELEAASGMIRALARKVGRIVFNGFPTGVEVGPAMQHGGPYPASTDSRFTSVGTAAIRRFIRPVCYQDVPQSALPEALRDGNPLGIWRTVDGKFGRA